MKPLSRSIPLIVFLCLSYTVFSQVPALGVTDLPLTGIQMEQVKQELERRNITQEELLGRLREKGVFLEQIPPDQLPAYEPIIMDTVRELEAEKEKDHKTPNGVVPMVDWDVDRLVPEEKPEERIPPLEKKEEKPLIYGHEPFIRRDISVYQTTDGARAPDSYILGTGDQLRITIFGDSQTDMLLEINQEGYIQPDETPQIYLKGLTIAEARPLLRERLSHYYAFRSDQFALTIKTVRTVTVHVFGETNERGSFSLSALNTAVNALVAAGGPTEIGSVRSIRHIRGTEQRKFDLYAFLHDPAVTFDFDLQHNDIIYVPVSNKIVEIRGPVKRPMKYELTAGEDLLDLIEFAGGIKHDAYPGFVQIKRIEDGEMRIREWELDDILSGLIKIDLHDGDIIHLREVERDLERYVEIIGAVFYDGKYNIEQNPTLSNLIERAQLRPQAKTDLLFIERTDHDESVHLLPVEWDDITARNDTVFLQNKDRVHVFDKERYRSIATISVAGDVREPFEQDFRFDQRITIANALAFAGGTKPTAADQAYIYRRDLSNPDILEHIPVSLVHDWDFQLQPGDELKVYDNQTYTNIPPVSIQGAVNHPFNTKFDSNITITDLLRMAGGVTKTAELSRIDIFRLQLSPTYGTRFDRFSLEVDSNFIILPEHSDFQLHPYDQVVVRKIPMFDAERSVQINGEIYYPGVYLLESRQIRLSELIDEAGGLTVKADQRNASLIRSFENTGIVSIDLKKAIQHPGEERYDPVLLSGDIITIPEFHNTVTIRVKATRLGDLKQQSLHQKPGLPDDQEVLVNQQDEYVTFLYQGARSARWYIENFAGGFADNADKRSVTVTMRNGQVIGTKRRMLLFNNYPTVKPGSTISLVFEPPPPEREETRVDWDRFYQQAMTTTTTLLTILVLIDRLTN